MCVVASTSRLIRPDGTTHDVVIVATRADHTVIVAPTDPDSWDGVALTDVLGPDADDAQISEFLQSLEEGRREIRDGGGHTFADVFDEPNA